MEIETGSRVKVEDKTAEAWGYKTPALGTVVGKDPVRDNPKVFSVKLDQVDKSIFETYGVNYLRLEKLEDDSN